MFQAGELELAIVQRVAMVVVAVVSTVLALVSDTVYGLFILTADILYVVLFPQLTCAVFIHQSNAYGSFLGFVLGVILRFGGGEPTLGLDPFIKYPNYDEEEQMQLFPYKTLAMLCTFVTIVLFSYLTRWLFLNEYLPNKWEITGKVMPSLNIQHTQDTHNAKEIKDAQIETLKYTNYAAVYDSTIL